MRNCCTNDYFIVRLKNNLEIKEVFDLQVNKVSADWVTVCRWKNYMKIEELSADRITICRLKNHCCSKNCLQTKDYLIGRLKNELQIKELSTDWQTFSRSQNYLQIKFQFADHLIHSFFLFKIALIFSKYLKSGKFCNSELKVIFSFYTFVEFTF